MFDITYLLINSFIVTIPILIFCVAHAVYTAVRAKKTGMIITVYPTVNIYFIVCIAAAVCFGTASVTCAVEAGEHNSYVVDIETRGIAAVEDHYGHEIPEYREVSSLHTEISCHSDKAKTAAGYAVRCAVDSVIFIVLAATCGAFITKDEVLIMGWFSPERPYAVLKNEYILFCDETEPGKVFLKLHATGKNLELCKDFIVSGNADNTESAKQN